MPQLAAKRVEVKARAGEGGKLFGSVTTADIVAAVLEQTGVTLDRRNVTLDEPIRELGSVEVAVKLDAGVEATVGVDVVAE